jgi:hypothetical protein
MLGLMTRHAGFVTYFYVTEDGWFQPGESGAGARKRGSRGESVWGFWNSRLIVPRCFV